MKQSRSAAWTHAARGAAAACAAAACAPASAGLSMPGAGSPAIRLTELRVDHQGADTDEYVEVSGPPGASLAGCWFVAIGDGASDVGGVVELALDLAAWSLGGNGCLVAREASFGTTAFGGRNLRVHADATDVAVGTGDSMNLENADSVTYLLVRGFSGTVGADLDTDNDGTLDVTPWAEVLDSVAFVRSGSKDPVYSATRLGPADLSATGGMPPHGWRDAKGWHVGGYASWDEDTPGAPSDVPVPAPGVGATLAAALVTGAPRRRVR